MGLQKYRFDRDGEAESNGSVPVYTDWMGGPSLAGVRQCPCEGYGTRTVYIQGEPDTYFSQPAAIGAKGKRVKGFITYETGTGFTFTPERS